jgi:hypothetical protein
MYRVEGQAKWIWYLWASGNGDIYGAASATGEITTLIPTGDTLLTAHMSLINVTTNEVHLNRGMWAISHLMV